VRGDGLGHHIPFGVELELPLKNLVAGSCLMDKKSPAHPPSVPL
jgi:hypothetical protein